MTAPWDTNASESDVDWPPLKDDPPSQRKHPLPPSMDPEQLPESWKPQKEATPSPTFYDGDRLGNRVPVCDTEDPAQLESWYSAWGFAEHWRKCVLANCREIERARAAARNEKLSEARIDDRARTSDPYIDFLITHLNGRRLREAAILGRMGA